MVYAHFATIIYPAKKKNQQSAVWASKENESLLLSLLF